jgi:hypothetical protein
MTTRLIERVAALEAHRRQARPRVRTIIMENGESVEDARRRLGLENDPIPYFAFPRKCETIEEWAAIYAPKRT